MDYVYFITHPEVQLDPAVPVPQWSLSDRGRARMRSALQQPWIASLTSLYCSTEPKATEGAEILAHHLALPVHQKADLGENDRSATGFLRPPEFEQVVDCFFAEPQTSVRGWETAQSAQRRIVRTVAEVLKDALPGNVAIIAHGAVGTLLLCHYAGYPIARRYDQPGTGGGNYFVFEAVSKRITQAWKPIDV